MLGSFLSEKLEEMSNCIRLSDLLKGRKYCYRKGFEDCASIMLPSMRFVASLDDQRMNKISALLELSKEELAQFIVENTEEARLFFK